MERHSASALTLARMLERHPRVLRVAYPGLPGFPQRAVAERQMSAGGGLLSFELDGGVEAGRRFMNALRLVTRAVSLGDAETLVQHPASMTHAQYSPEERAKHGIADGLIRMSVGLETVADLEDDIDQALEAAFR
jgi:methionine-gamma-lyase